MTNETKQNEILETKLDELFPKGDKARGRALVLWVTANHEINKARAEGRQEGFDEGCRTTIKANDDALTKKKDQVQKLISELADASQHIDSDGNFMDLYEFVTDIFPDCSEPKESELDGEARMLRMSQSEAE